MLRGLLTADAVMAVEDDRRLLVERQQRLVVGLVQQPGTGDRCNLPLSLGPYVNQLKRLAAADPGLQFGYGDLLESAAVLMCSCRDPRREICQPLANASSLVRGRVFAYASA